MHLSSLKIIHAGSSSCSKLSLHYAASSLLFNPTTNSSKSRDCVSAWCLVATPLESNRHDPLSLGLAKAHSPDVVFDYIARQIMWLTTSSKVISDECTTSLTNGASNDIVYLVAKNGRSYAYPSAASIVCFFLYWFKKSRTACDCFVLVHECRSVVGLRRSHLVIGLCSRSPLHS